MTLFERIVRLDARPIPGFPCYYADRNGVIYSIKARRRNGLTPEVPRVMKNTLGSNGYYYLRLWRGSNRYRKTVAELVLMTFVSARPRGMVVCHGVAGCRDNRLSNLCWGTRSKNHGEDRLRDGTDNRGEKHGMSKLNQLQVRVIRRSYVPHDSKRRPRNNAFGLSTVSLGKVFNVSDACISDILHNKRWKHLSALEAVVSEKEKK